MGRYAIGVRDEVVQTPGANYLRGEAPASRAGPSAIGVENHLREIVEAREEINSGVGPTCQWH